MSMYTLFSHPVTVFLTSFIFFASWITKMGQKVVFLGMGGTIAGKARHPGDNVGYTAGQVDVADLLLAIPALTGILDGREMVVEQVAQMDSKDMDCNTPCPHSKTSPASPFRTDDPKQAHSAFAHPVAMKTCVLFFTVACAAFFASEADSQTFLPLPLAESVRIGSLEIPTKN